MSGMRHQYIVPYGPYLASDGRFISLVVADDRQWRILCNEVIGRPEWIDDPIMATIASRRENRAQAEAAVEAIIASQPSETWLERLDRAGIPHGRVNKIADVLEHPQALARKMFVEAESPVGTVPLVRFPLAPFDKARVLPGLGEHTDEVIAALKNSEEP